MGVVGRGVFGGCFGQVLGVVFGVVLAAVFGGVSGAFLVGFVSPFRTVKSGAAARDRARVGRGDL